MSTTALTATSERGCQSRYAAVGIVASAGGIPALIDLLSSLPGTFELPIFITQHLSRAAPSILPELLGRHTPLAVKWAEAGEEPVSGVVYTVPPTHQLQVGVAGLALTALAPRSSAWLASADALLESMAVTYGDRAIGVVLSGMLGAGSRGLRSIKKGGGIVMAQNAASAAHFDMPLAAIDWGKADIIYPPHRIAEALTVLATLQ